MPRRARLDLNTPAELAIRDAMRAVEETGAHALLTDAVVLLAAALDKVADFAENEWAEPPTGWHPTIDPPWTSSGPRTPQGNDH